MSAGSAAEAGPGSLNAWHRMSAAWRRVWLGLGANAFGQLVTIGTQLLALPLFLHYWSVEQYGVWLMISAVPAYFSLADVGVGTVAMNKMTMLVAQGRQHEANGVFQTAMALTLVSTLALLLLSLAAIWSFDMGPVRDTATRATLSILIATTLLGMFNALFDGLFRSAGQFAIGTFAIHSGRLFEWLGGAVGLMLYRTLPAVALGSFLARIVAYAVMWNWARRRFRQFHWGLGAANRRELLKLLPPAIAFLALPLGNALLLQGTTIVVGSTFGPVALAAFNSFRTLSRVPVQLLTMFSRSLWPEMSRSYGAGDLALLSRLYRHSVRIAIVGCAVACAALFIAGPLVLRLWSHDKIAMDAMLFGLLLVAALAGCAWQVAQVLLSATNTHARLSLWYVGTASLVVLLAALLPATLGMNAVALALILFEVAMFVVSRQLVAAPLARGAR